MDTVSRKAIIIIIIMIGIFSRIVCACPTVMEIEAIPGNTVSVGQTVTFIASCDVTPQGYQWILPASAYNVTGLGTEQITCKFSPNGNYQVQVLFLFAGNWYGPAIIQMIVVPAEPTWYVSPDGNDDNNGQSWESAFQNIQTAIDSANDGDEIIVAEGIYRECISLKGKDITISSTNPDDWSVVENTIINGHGRGAVVFFEGTETSDCHLKGITVMGGGTFYEDPSLAGDIGKIAHWKMDDMSGQTVVQDYSGRGHTGTADAAIVSTTGKVDNAIEFNEFQYIMIADDPDFQFGETQDFSIAGWFKTMDDGFCTIVRKFTNTDNGYFYIRKNGTNNKLEAAICDGDTSSVIAFSNESVRDGIWHHFAAIFDRDGDLSLYLDGIIQLEHPDISTVGNINCSVDLMIANYMSGTQPWIGDLDDIQIYNRVLSKSEIRSLAGDVGKIAHWKLDDMSDQTMVKDCSGRNHNGTAAEAIVSTTGKLDNAIEFNNSQHITVADSSHLDFQFGETRDFSIAGWFKTEETTTVNCTVISKWNSTDGGFIIRKDINHKLQVLIDDGTIQKPVYSTDPVNDGVWHHFCAVIDRDKNLSLYINGTLQDDEPVDDIDNINNSSAVRIGSVAGNQFWNTGALDDIQIYNRVLVEEEIRILASVPPAPVAYWKLDTDADTEDSVLDSSGNGHNGTPNNNMTAIDGMVGKAFEFNGTTDYISVSSSEQLNLVADMTISAWVCRRTQDDTNWPFIVHKGSAAQWYSFYLAKSSGKLMLRLGDGTESKIWFSANEISLNKWHHIALVITSDQYIKFYIDGFDAGIGNGSAVLPYTLARTVSDSDLLIGRDQINGNYFDGSLDDVRIYDKALSGDEIQSLAEDPGKVAHWKLDDDGSIATDSSGSGYDGMLWGDSDWVSGKLNRCLEFDGMDDYVEIPGYSGVSGSQARACSAWIRTTQKSGFILSYGTQTTGQFWLFILNGNGRLQLGVYGGNIIGTQDVADGQWHHVAAVLEATPLGIARVQNLRLYVDGQPETGVYTNPDQEINTGGDVPVKIGSNASNSYFAGWIDDVRMYNRILRPSEIQSLYTRGGGIWGNGAQSTISNCIIKYNKSAEDGGGIWNIDGNIASCFIINNKSEAHGGGLADCDGMIINCIVADNEADSGGGVNNCNADINNCTVVNNIAINSVGGIKDGIGTLTNTILWGNTDTGTDILGTQISGGNHDVNYSCIQDNDPDDSSIPFSSGTGNIDDNPVLEGDYHLDESSPCRNAGDPGSNYSDQFDLDQEARVLDWGVGRVDIGADEWYPSGNDTWYVDDDGPADFSNIQDTIDAASDWDIIIIKEGTYTGDDNRDIDFYGKIIKVQSTDPDNWNIVANTIIDCEGSASVPHRGFYFHNEENNDSVVSGLTITGGYAEDEASSGWRTGGAILCENSSPTIRNCVIRDNCVSNNSYGFDDDVAGGGILCHLSACPKIMNCILYNNAAAWGGAIGVWGEYIYGSGIFIAAPQITNCIINDNKGQWGAGIGIALGTGTKIINSTIFENHAYCGATGETDAGGLSIYSDSTIDVVNCIFWGNSREDEGNDIVDEQAQICDAYYAPVTYCCVEEWTQGGTGNTFMDPSFLDPSDPAGEDNIWGTEDDGLQLAAGSSCIDTADGDSVPSFDIRNRTRLDISGYTGGSGNPDYADIGAYELNGTCPYNARTMEVYLSIQEAINSSSTINGDILILPEGTYKGEGNRDIDFGGKAITVQSTDPDNWNIVANTIIDCEGSASVPHRGFYFHSGEDNDSVVSGLTITGGYGQKMNSGDWTGWYSGGGILCQDKSSPTISNCIITGNTCVDLVEGQEDGGGIACYDESNAQILNCIITDNSAKYAGGISYLESSPTIQNCVISDNTAFQAAGIGGWSGAAEITNCTIFNNDAASEEAGAGLYTDQYTIITNCIFWDNSANGGDSQYSQTSTAISFYSYNTSYCCIEGWTQEGSGNIALNPSFLDPSDPDGDDNIWGTEDDGLQLGTGSSCIDAADGDIAPITDLLNKSRFDVINIDHGGVGTTSGITYGDLGAYESYADTDGDGLPDAWEKEWWPDDDLSLHDCITDSDSDGVDDRIEYIFGYNPTEDSSSEPLIFGYQTGGNIYAPVAEGSARMIINKYEPDQSGEELSFDFCVNKNCDVYVSFKRTDEETWLNPVRTIEVRDVMMGELCVVNWDGRNNSDNLVDRYFYDVKIEEAGNPEPLWDSESTHPGEDSEINYDTDGTRWINANNFNAFKNIPLTIHCNMIDYAEQNISIVDESDSVVKTICDHMLGKDTNTFYWYGHDDNGELFYGTDTSVDFGPPTPVRKGVTLVYYDRLLTNLKCNPYRLISSGDELTTITYDLTIDAKVTVEIYDTEGSLFARVAASEEQIKGPQSLTWNGRSNAGECITNEGPCRIKVSVDGSDEMLEGTITVYK